MKTVEKMIRMSKNNFDRAESLLKLSRKLSNLSENTEVEDR